MKTVKDPVGKPSSKKRGAVSKATTEAAHNGLRVQGLRAQGLRTRNAIVDVARNLLLEGGSLEFSLREVAARAGIRISNLQYYFPTKLDVLRAVIEPLIEAYLEDLRGTLDGDEPPRVALNALMKRALQDAENPEITALWWHFASLAAIDAECSRLLDEWYEALTRGLAQLIRANCPECSLADSLHRATLLIAMAEGLSYQLGSGRRERDYTRGLDTKYTEVTNYLLRGGGPVPVD